MYSKPEFCSLALEHYIRISCIELKLQISRKDADQFEPGQWIPECQLLVEWEKKDHRPMQLRHRVDLLGAKPTQLLSPHYKPSSGRY